MIAFLKGIIALKTPTRVEIDVGGVGYGLSIPVSTFDRLGAVGDPARLYTHLNVRQDALVLYGFGSPDEREMFELLITVSGIGPKVALAVLSTLDAFQVQNAVLTGDVRSLSSVPGIGKKTAERIVLDLRDKIHRRKRTAPSPGGEGAAPDPNQAAEDAVSALCTLGYSSVEARRAVAESSRDASGDVSIEQLIRTALNRLGAN
jgi:Holliday junction DNA helicase RuvA